MIPGENELSLFAPGEFEFISTGVAETSPIDIRSAFVPDTYLADLHALSLASLGIEHDGSVGSSEIGLLAIGESKAAVGGSSVVLRAGSEGYTSKRSDNPPITYWEPRLRNPINYDVSVLGGIMTGHTRVDADMTIENGDGALDHWIGDLAFEGRRATIRSGYRGNALSAFLPIFSGTIALVEARTSDIFVLFRDRPSTWGRTLQTSRYNGSGGLDGTLELKGKPKPLLFGPARNIPAILVDPLTLTYQVHAGALDSLSRVMEGMVPLALVASAPVPGEYSQDLSAGTFMLGAPAQRQITCDATAAGPQTWGTILETLLVQYAGLSTAEYDRAALASELPGIADQAAGIWFGAEDVELRSAIGAWLEGAAVFAGDDLDGVYSFGIVRPPNEISGQAIEINQNIIGELEKVALPAELSPIVWRVSVGYDRNYAVSSDVAAGASAEDAQAAVQEYRISAVEDLAAKSRYPSAQEITIFSPFSSEASAQLLALRLARMWGKRRLLLRATLPASAARIRIGAIVSARYPRYRLSDAKTGMVVASRFSAEEGQAELSVII